VGSCPVGSVPAAEEATFNQDGDAIPGEAEEVLACLNYNVEGVDLLGVINPVGTNLGNDFRFDSCGDSCNALNCSNLPRSLIPLAAYDPQAYVPGDPADESDIVAILNCFDNCNNFNCQAMPAAQVSTGAPYPYNTALFNQTIDCANGGASVPGEPVGVVRANIIAALIQAGPSCNFSPNGWLANTRQAALEARNQIAKFKKRRDFLAGRINEMNRLVSEVPGSEGIFTIADQKLTAFINGPANALIQEVIRSKAESVPKLPYHVIYGWQSDPSPGDVEGLWHIVKVEARTPGRCDNACGGGFGGNINTNEPDPQWPRVKTYRKSWGFRRCYEFTDDQGIVKFRTIRYDQKRDTQQMLKFPNQLKLWAFRSAPNPEGRPGGNPGSLGIGAPGDNGSTCGSIAHPDPTGLSSVVAPGIYRGAFLMNDRISEAEATNANSPKYNLQPNENCWDAATELLTVGIVSETCAAYYYGDRGMTFRFINCAEF
jgi:hypothetical protein